MHQLQKYIWLINTIHSAGKISYKDLSAKWEDNKDLSDNKPLPRATFNRWIDAIFSQFGIIISCQRANGYLYYIENSESLNENGIKKWMIDTFAVNNVIRDSMVLKDRILVDSIPSGHKWLLVILHAMRTDKALNIIYHTYHESVSRSFLIEPYCIKLFQNRWYMLGYDAQTDRLLTYALDRMEDVCITDISFTPLKSFNANDYFENYFGVVTDSEVKPIYIVIRAYKRHKHYLMSLPLHHSQKLLHNNAEYAEFELYLAPTYDFVMKLLQAGAMVEVIKPQSLRLQIKNWISDMVELYELD